MVYINSPVIPLPLKRPKGSSNSQRLASFAV